MMPVVKTTRSSVSAGSASATRRASAMRLRSASTKSIPRVPASWNVRPTTVTAAPLAASRRAKARPMPPVPPMIAAFFPLNSEMAGAVHVKFVMRFMPNPPLQAVAPDRVG